MPAQGRAGFCFGWLFSITNQGSRPVPDEMLFVLAKALRDPCRLSVPEYPIGRDMDGGAGIAAYWLELCQKERAVGDGGNPAVWMLVS